MDPSPYSQLLTAQKLEIDILITCLLINADYETHSEVFFQENKKIKSDLNQVSISKY